MKIKKDAQRRKAKKEEMPDTNKIGEVVPLVTSLNSGCDISEIYLKRTGDESSEDEEGTEKPFTEEDEDERKEMESFRKFLENEQIKQKNKQSEASTSQDVG